MSKNKVLVVIIGFLVLTNIAVLIYFLRPAKKEHDGEKKSRSGMSIALQKEVGFNDDQIAKYRALKEEQFKIMRPMMEDIRHKKDSMFRLMGNANATDSIINQLATEIAAKQKDIDIRAFNHFKRIRLLCTPDQLTKYDSVVVKMIRKMGKPGKPAQEGKSKD
jgi:Spy/CpxP family protein refolding chaperone